MNPVRHFDQLLAYWHSLKAANDDAVPSRRQFHPMRVHRLLPYIYILERRSGSDLHVRIAGTALEAGLGRSVTGVNYLDLYDPGQWGFFTDLIGAVCNQPCGGVAHREVTFKNGAQFDMHSLNLPLADTAGANTIILGMMSMRRSLPHLPGAQESTVHSQAIRNFELIDLGFGVPDKTPITRHLQTVPA